MEKVNKKWEGAKKDFRLWGPDDLLLALAASLMVFCWCWISETIVSSDEMVKICILASATTEHQSSYVWKKC